MAKPSSEPIGYSIMDHINDPEVQAGIKQLNVDPANDRFMKLVEDLLRPESLPRGWSSEFIAADGKWVYKDKQGRLHDHHPVYDYYMGAMFMDQGGYARLKAIAAERPPTSEEVKQMGLYLHIKEGEDSYLWEIAEMALCAPMPEHWEEVVEGTPDAPHVTFRNKSSGVVSDEHPLDNYFRELLRRRRLQLMRRKMAALKALQALVRMGGARRSLLSNIVAQKKKTEDQTVTDGAATELEFDDNIEAMSEPAQAALIAAWQGLLGSAAYTVECLQAAHWNGAIGSSTDSEPTAAATAPEGEVAATGPVQDRLQLLSDKLRSAYEPGGAAAAGVLQCIQQLAAQAAAAGDDANKLAEVLAAQGIRVPVLSILTDNTSSSDKQASSNVQTGHTVQGSCMAAELSAASADGTASTALGSSKENDGQQHGQLAHRRPSIDHSQQAAGSTSLTRRQSLLADQVNHKQVDFVQVQRSPGPTAVVEDATAKAQTFSQPSCSTAGTTTSAFCSSSGVYASIGPYSSTGGSSQAEPWSLSGAAPTDAGAAAAQQARAAAAAAGGIEGKGNPVANAGVRSLSQAQEHVVRLLQGRESVVHVGGAHQLMDNQINCEPSRAEDGKVQAVQSQTPSDNHHQQQQQQQQRQEGDLATAQNLVVCLQDLPVTAEAALQHMTALQAVITEACSVIQSWQQQRLLILLLQQRLAAADRQAQANQARLRDAEQQVEQLKQEQQVQAAATAAECQTLQQQLQDALQQLQSLQEASNLQQHVDTSEKSDLQQSLNTALAAAAVQQQQLQSQLAAVQEELQGEQQQRQQAQQQHAQVEAELEKLMAEHIKLQECSGAEAAAVAAQHSQLLSDHQQLQEQHAKLQELLAQEQATAADVSKRKKEIELQLQQSRLENQQLQEAHVQLQAMHDQQIYCTAELQKLHAEMQDASKQQGAELAECKMIIEQLQQQLEVKDIGYSKMHQSYTALQGDYNAALQKEQTMMAQMARQNAALSKVSQELAQAQQQLAEARHLQQQTEQQMQQLQAQNEKALEDQIAIMDNNRSLIKEIKDLRSAAEAAEKIRLSKPSKVTQITAVDADQQHWTHPRSVQTGSDIDPRSKRDIGTPADLALLSYFFRDIKHKLRGGGGAIIGYDPENAREAAAAAASHDGQVHKSDKSWSGGALPGLSTEARRTASSPGGAARPHTNHPGTNTFRKTTPEPEVKEGNLDLRPVSWEVKQRVDRRRDREIKLRHEPQPGSAAGGAGGHDRWDYSQDERDNEIAELKKRLIDVDKKNKEAAAKAADELREATLELQNTKRTSEQLQSDNFTLRKEINSLRLAMQAAGLTVSDTTESLAGASRTSLIARSSIAGAPRISISAAAGTGMAAAAAARSSIAAARSSMMSAPLPGRASVFSKSSSAYNTAPRSSTFFGRPQTSTSTSQSRRFSSAGGGTGFVTGDSVTGGVSNTNNMLMARNSLWGSGYGGGSGLGNPGVLAGGLSVSGSGSAETQGFLTSSSQADAQQQGPVGMLSLSGAASGSIELVSNSSGSLARGTRGSPGQQLVPTIRSTSAALD